MNLHYKWKKKNHFFFSFFLQQNVCCKVWSKFLLGDKIRDFLLGDQERERVFYFFFFFPATFLPLSICHRRVSQLSKECGRGQQATEFHPFSSCCCYYYVLFLCRAELELIFNETRMLKLIMWSGGNSFKYERVSYTENALLSWLFKVQIL